MNIKTIKLREIFVVIFIVLGVLAFLFEKQFEPKYYFANAAAEGYNDDISVEVKAYKKKNGDIRFVTINYRHSDTDEIAVPAISSMIGQIMSLQNLDLVDTVAGATFSTEGFLQAVKDTEEQIKSQD